MVTTNRPNPGRGRSFFTYRLTLEYHGGRFFGWQIQPGRRTVQEELEKALRTLFQERVTCVGASRTDAGVHAQGQGVSFRATKIFRGNLIAALNALLPPDMAVLSATQAKDSFHARNQAKAKTYRYRLINRPARPALSRYDAAWEPCPLNLAAMKREAEKILKQRDFADLAGPASRHKDSRCRLFSLKIQKRGDEILFDLTADRFLHRMARRIVGRLIEAGGGRFAKTAPAQGLCLVRVSYEKSGNNESVLR